MKIQLISLNFHPLPRQKAFPMLNSLHFLIDCTIEDVRLSRKVTKIIN